MSEIISSLSCRQTQKSRRRRWRLARACSLVSKNERARACSHCSSGCRSPSAFIAGENARDAAAAFSAVAAAGGVHRRDQLPRLFAPIRLERRRFACERRHDSTRGAQGDASRRRTRPPPPPIAAVVLQSAFNGNYNVKSACLDTEKNEIFVQRGASCSDGYTRVATGKYANRVNETG